MEDEEIRQWVRDATKPRRKACAFCANEAARVLTSKVLTIAVEQGDKCVLARLHKLVVARTGINRELTAFKRHVRECFPDLYRKWQAL